MIHAAVTESQSNRRRRAVLGMLLSGLGIVLAILWGIWALMHSQTGVLIVTSRPAGAEVILNYRPTDLLTSAFLSDLPADSFVVSIRLDGYRPIPPRQIVAVRSNDTTRVAFLLAPIVRGDTRDLPKVSGTPHNWKWRIVRISSEPEGAALIVDDRELGVRTPVTILFEHGLHHLQARWPDGARSFKNLMIEPAQTTSGITLRPVTYVKPSQVSEDTVP